MRTEHLLARRAAVIARHEVLESVPGSGWHRDDPQARDEQRAGMVPISKRPVVLHHDGRFFVVGPCVAVLRAALARFVERFRAERDRVAAEHAALDLPPPELLPQAAQAEAVAARVAADAAEVIDLPSNQWNACVYALNETGINVVSAGVVG